MSIDVHLEQVLSLHDALTIIPKTRRGKSAHISTIHRWVQRGLQGVRLETISIGGVRCTSREALQRFFTRVTQVMDGRDAIARDGPVGEGRRAQQVEAQLDLIGI